MKLQRINCYRCQYGCNTWTVDVDKGVTPMMIKCRSKPTAKRPIAEKYLDKNGECIGIANSNFYPKLPPPPYADVKLEWYAPSKDEISKMDLGMQEHCKKGGLLLRERTDREPIYHDEPEQSQDSGKD